MSTHQVNLDALIRREDFASSTGTTQSNRLSKELRVEDLERTYLHLLRKPDFQRETANWNPEKISDFITSFVDGHLIPGTIMWWSSLTGTVFVIDGAHRLSALLAWVHDDYGDGPIISGPFFGHVIPPQQKRLAEETRKLVAEKVGKYAWLKRIAMNPHEAPNDQVLIRARNIGTFRIDLQWVEGDARAAEDSFFRINTGSSIIDPTELAILRARRKPNAIATRALMRSGTGHKYWSSFADDTQNTIEDLAREISDGLFKPLLETPIKTLDLPIAGQAYSAESFKMILDLVNLVNNVSLGMWQPRMDRRKRVQDPALPDDTDGEATVGFLKKVKRASLLISGSHPGSLGLHPVVYFYGATGKFQPTAFLAAIKFASDLKANDRLNSFTAHRREFEEFLVRHRDFTNQLSHTYGSRTRSLEPLLVMYRTILEQIENGVTDDAAIVQRLQEEPRLRDLKLRTEGKEIRRRRFTTDARSAAFIRESIDSPIRCAICGARLHRLSISADHKLRAQDGGLGTAENAQMTHFYCNTGYKESAHARSRLQSAD